MPLSTIFQLYRGGQFYWWRKLEDPEKMSYIIARLYLENEILNAIYSEMHIYFWSLLFQKCAIKNVFKFDLCKCG
jgi:hypothetical protein